MSLFQSAVLGAVQGLAEFLPVSSSAHLALAPWLLGWPDQGLAYDVALHWGTLIGVMAYFHKDLLALLRAGFSRRAADERALFWGIVLATVPGALAGFFLDDYVETVFRRPEVIAVPLILFGLLLGAADLWGRKKWDMRDVRWFGCLLIGTAQAAAVIPGVSRSAATIAAGLALGLKRVDAARFSFLLSVPIIMGAGVLKARDLAPADLACAPFWLGIVVSAAVGAGAIHFLLNFLKKRSLMPFVVYRVALGALILYLALRPGF